MIKYSTSTSECFNYSLLKWTTCFWPDCCTHTIGNHTTISLRLQHTLSTNFVIVMQWSFMCIDPEDKWKWNELWGIKKLVSLVNYYKC